MLSCGPEVHEAVYRCTRKYLVDFLHIRRAIESTTNNNPTPCLGLPLSRSTFEANIDVAYASCLFVCNPNIRHAFALGLTSSLRFRRISVLLSLL